MKISELQFLRFEIQCVCMCVLENALLIGIVLTVFTNGPGGQDSISDLIKPKIQKIVLDASLLINQHYKVQIKARYSSQLKGEAPTTTPW